MSMELIRTVCGVCALVIQVFILLHLMGIL